MEHGLDRCFGSQNGILANVMSQCVPTVRIFRAGCSSQVTIPKDPYLPPLAPNIVCKLQTAHVRSRKQLVFAASRN